MMIKLTERQRQVLTILASTSFATSTNSVARQMDIEWKKASETLDALARKGLVWRGGWNGNKATQAGKQWLKEWEQTNHDD